MIGTTVNDRYQIEEEIGKGGMGTVYRALDKTLKRDVALKLLSTTRLGTEGRARMLREAQTVARLNHPNIVTVFDAGEHEENPYIIMELVAGKTLAEAPPQDLDEKLLVAEQICAALNHAHEQNIIHRDLKPENIIVQPDGTLKLMDFGLARPVASRMTEEGTIMGTVHYMAPEQAMGRDVDHRTDLYSLGVLLYEFLTGSLPFEAENAVAIITQHISAPVVPPRAKNEDVPYYLDHLVQQLLNKNPIDRPQTATEVLRLISEKNNVAPDKDKELSVLDRIARGRMIGRSAEINEAQMLWQQSDHGSGQLLLISGEPGIGKSRFTKEVITNAEISGGLVLLGASYAEGGMPYSAFRQILRKGLRSSAGKKLDIPHEILKDLLTLAPELRSSYPDLKAEISSELPDPQQLWEHFVIFINMLSAEIPVLIVIEDIHWSDSGSLALARQLARQTQENAVMLLYNYREVEIHENRAFHGMLLDFNRERLGKRIKLIRLNKEQTHEMLYALFHEEITTEFLEGIYRETEGHPFFIEEVIKALVESGRLYYKDGSWHRPSIEELGIPQSVHVAIQSRLDQLSDSAHDLLRQAAIFGREFNFRMLMQASKLDEMELIDILELSESAQIVEEIDSDTADARFAFMHALIPTTLIEDTRTLKRRVLHRRAAEAIEAYDPGNIQALAYHLTEAGEVEKAVEYHLRLADQARFLLANQEAIHSYQQALDFLRETDQFERTRDTLFKLALTYQNNFDFAASQQIYDEAFALLKQSEVPDEDLPPAPHALRYAIPPATSLDPAIVQDVTSSFMVGYFFGSLVKQEPGGNIVPDMALRWEIKDAGRRYIFSLRKDLKWTDGKTLNAHDFEFGWKRTLNPQTKSETANLLYVVKNAEAYHTGQMDDPDLVGVKATDEHTLEVNLKQPTAYFLHLCAFSTTFAQPQHVIEKHKDDWTKSENYTSCGPFRLVSQDDNDRTIVERNPHYHKPFTGNLERIEFMHKYAFQGDAIQDDVLKAYLDEKIDVFFLGAGTSNEQRNRARRELIAEIRTSNFHSLNFVAFNCIEPPFDNPVVRRAFAMALDKDYLVGEVLHAILRPAHGGITPPGVAGHNPDIGIQYDPIQARRLLADAGYPNGEGFPELRAKSASFFPGKDAALYLAKQWKDVLNIDLIWEETTFQDMMDISFGNAESEEPYPLFTMGWNLDYPDPHSGLIESSWLRGSGWKNKAFDDLIETAITTLDQQARIRLYQQADRIAIEESPLIPLGYGHIEWLIKPWVKQFHPNADTTWSDPTAVVIEPHD